MPLEARPRQHGCDVLIFDSGVGGISILQSIHTFWPVQYRLAYASDNEAFPYGTKDESWLIERVDRVMSQLILRVQPRLIVIACNTASTLVLPTLRARHDIPFVGVIPAIKPAAERSQSRVLGLLATPGTIRRPYTQKLIEDFAADCTVIRVGSARLVEIAEEKLMGQRVSARELALICEPLLDAVGRQGLDQLVLGCTHFPLLSDELRQLFPDSVNFVDSGKAIAARVSQLLPVEEGAGFSDPLAFVTKPVPRQHPLRDGLKHYGFRSIETVQVFSGD